MTLELLRPAPLVLWKEPVGESTLALAIPAEPAVASNVNADLWIPTASLGVDLSAEEDEFGVRSGLFVAHCLERPQGGGICSVQGAFPCAPNEGFSITVLSLGTFGEIALGLAPPRAEAFPPGTLPPKDAAPAADGAVAVMPDMVGWTANEVGFLGDHGSCYMLSRQVGRNISKPWAVGDKIECGIDSVGGVYFTHNGKVVTELSTRWRLGLAYPTVTMRSAGARVELNFRGIEPKPLPRRPAATGAAAATGQPTLQLLAAFKQVSIPEKGQKPGPGVPLLERLFGRCSSLEMAR
ncbi:unnamed protein product [Polarella glacialis]|uniref:B30.2/SPRY domain-containing protein n=2 Tax=Polarella glacialis TaxID=89957 RepID=A0A813G7U0_POLGL|nr:unnamed protein product [Polarella glacialis]